MNKYIIIIGDLKIGYEEFFHKDIIEVLSKNNEWIFSKFQTNTLKGIKPGDLALVYLAGNGNRYFYGHFEICSCIKPIDSLKSNFYNFFKGKIDIKNFIKWNKKILMKEIKNDLSFIKDKKNYGLHLRQSIRKISNEDYKIILDKYNCLDGSTEEVE